MSKWNGYAAPADLVNGRTRSIIWRILSARAFQIPASAKRGEITMYKITGNGIDRLDIEMSGKLNSDEMKMVLDELENKSRNILDGKMLYDVIDFHLPSLNAIAVEFSRLPSMWKVMKKFRRAAVLTDKTWIKKISEFEGLFFPNLRIKGFDRNQKAEAEAWLDSPD
jgi:hypothetical protein